MDPLERKNIEDLSDAELAAYEHAVGKLLDDPNPATNYKHHADFHNVFSQNPPRGCEHRNDLFFPWHRYHLYNFERALQASDPDHPTLSTRAVTIPYWDWTVAPRHGIRYPKAFEDPASRLFNEERNSDATEPAFTPDYLTGVIRQNPDWHKFAGGPKGQNELFGALENPAHNDMHGIIGPPMSNPLTAAEDPIYWSFHCFIDRIWERWSRIHKTPPTCLDCNLRGFPGDPTTRTVEHTEASGYFYAFSAQEIAPLPGPDRHTELFRMMTADPSAAPEELLTLKPTAKPLTYALPKLKLPPNRADLWLVQLAPPLELSYRVEVFVHPKDAEVRHEDPDFRGRYHAGHFSFWKAHHLAPGQTAGAFIPLTAALRGIAQSEAEFEIRLVPTALAESGGHSGHDHEHGHGGHGGRNRGVHFQSVALQLNGNGVPKIWLGGAARHGR